MLRIFQRTTGRVAGSISRRRRSRFAGPAVLLIGLLLTGGLYAAFARRRRRRAGRRERDRQGQGPVPRRLLLLPRPERRGHRHQARQAARPAAGRRRRRRRRLPGRHRPDADGPARRPGPAQEGPSTPTRRSARSRRTSPPSAPARRSPTESDYDVSDASNAERRPRWPDLPDQLHRLPQLRRLRRRDAAAASTRPSLTDVERAAHLRGDAHRSAADADLLRRRPLARGEARRHRLPRRSPRRPPATAASPSARSVPVTEGLFALARRHRRAARLRDLDRGPHRPRRRRRQARATHERRPRHASDDHARRGRRPDRRPGSARAPAAPDRRRPGRREARRAPGRDALRPLGRLHRALFASPTSPSRSATTPTTIGGLGASNVALGGFLGLALLFIGIGAIQWARKLMGDHEIVEMRHPLGSSDEDRDEALEAFNTGVDGVRHRPPPADPQLAARRAGPARPAGRSSCCATSARCRATSSSTPSGRRACASSATSSAPRSARATSRSATWSTPSPRSSSRTAPTASRLSRASSSPDAKAKAAVVLVRMDPDDITPEPGRENWGVDGILCYSKICTHVGCPISLYEQQTHHLLCPCHQSTFDLADNGEGDLRPGRPSAAAAAASRWTARATSWPRATSTNPSARASGSEGDPEHEHASHEQRQQTADGGPQAQPGRRPPPSGPTTASAWPTLAKKQLRKVFPDHWSFMLGEIALWSFVVLLLTGVVPDALVHARAWARSTTTAPTTSCAASRCRRPTPRR